MTAVDVARKYVGVKSDDPRVLKWLSDVGIDRYDSWCAAFVYACFKEAYGSKNPIPKTASALNVYGKSAPAKRVQDPQAGYVYVIYRGNGHGHVGVVESIEPGDAGDVVVTEISGNSTAGAVARHRWSLATARASGIHEGKLMAFLVEP